MANASVADSAPIVLASVFIVSSLFGDDDGPVLCPIRRCTGGYCPGCGGSRAFTSMLRGDLATSWSFNPWVLVTAIQAIVVAGLAMTRVRDQLHRFVVPVLLANMAFSLTVWIMRLSAGSIPVPFA